MIRVQKKCIRVRKIKNLCDLCNLCELRIICVRNYEERNLEECYSGGHHRADRHRHHPNNFVRTGSLNEE